MSKIPGFSDGDHAVPETYGAALADLERFSAIESETLLGITTIEGLNALLGEGALAANISTVIKANASIQLMPMLIRHDTLDDGFPRRHQVFSIDDVVSYSRVRYNPDLTGGLLEEMVVLPPGPLAAAAWRESSVMAQTAESWDEDTWAAYYPCVETGPIASYMHYGDDQVSYGKYAQCVQDMTRETLRLLSGVEA